MKAKKILFITQEIAPYVSTSQLATAGREIPQATQESGREIRTFMPRWGHINERRNQLHEVIRLSGMNIIIDDTDHPLIIKVASIQPARMQVYFIDNDDYFHKRLMKDDDKGVEYADNTERAIFYARGVLETVKKLRWTPDVIHCQGWMSAIVPLYIKHAYQDEPTFKDAKVVFSAFDEAPTATPADNVERAVCFRGANTKAISAKGIDLSKPESLSQLAIAFSDGFIQSGNNETLTAFAEAQGIPCITCPGDKTAVPAITEFYDKITGSDEE
ncbi:MAG: glycogen/starch synthase [Bacteroidales bacterium]|nr:glycogen/starch synthase [Bacteroidales bacterium]